MNCMTWKKIPYELINVAKKPAYAAVRKRNDQGSAQAGGRRAGTVARKVQGLPCAPKRCRVS